jgi:hypothetical protein
MIVRICRLSDKDSIRIEEQQHEAKLKKLLKTYGITYESSNIRHFGMGWINNNQRNNKQGENK